MEAKKAMMVLWLMLMCYVSGEVMVAPMVLSDKVLTGRRAQLNDLLRKSLPKEYKMPEGSGLQLEEWLLEITGLPEEKVANVPESVVIPMGYYQKEGEETRCFLSGMVIQLKPERKVLKIVNLEKKGAKIDEVYMN